MTSHVADAPVSIANFMKTDRTDTSVVIKLGGGVITCINSWSKKSEPNNSYSMTGIDCPVIQYHPMFS